jgi:hypothetical protein
MEIFEILTALDTEGINDRALSIGATEYALECESDAKTGVARFHAARLLRQMEMLKWDGFAVPTLDELTREIRIAEAGARDEEELFLGTQRILRGWVDRMAAAV